MSMAHQSQRPEVMEIQCQEKKYFACQEWMTREEMLRHYTLYHATYGANTIEDIECFYEHERERRYRQ